MLFSPETFLALQGFMSLFLLLLLLLLQGYYLQCFGYSNDKGIIWYDCASQVERLAEHEYEPIRFGSAVTVKGNVVVCGDYRSAIYNTQKDLYVFFTNRIVFIHRDELFN